MSEISCVRTVSAVRDKAKLRRTRTNDRFGAAANPENGLQKKREMRREGPWNKAMRFTHLLIFTSETKPPKRFDVPSSNFAP